MKKNEERALILTVNERMDYEFQLHGCAKILLAHETGVAAGINA
jgi:hypothetical protein